MANLLTTVLSLFTLVLLARAVLSWFPIGYDSPVRPIADLLHRVTEPVLAPVRRLIPPIGGFDISFLVVVFGINLVLIPLIRQVF
ncbi:MAG: YggT family protein [Actinomycetota bacterium]